METTALVNNLKAEVDMILSSKEEKKVIQSSCSLTDHEKQDSSSKILLKFAEDQKKEVEELHGKFIELKKMIDAEHALNLETKQKLVEIEKKLSEKEEVEDLAAFNHILVSERKSNDELQEARKMLISELRNAGGNIGLKRMGEIDRKSFFSAAKQKYPSHDLMWLSERLSMSSHWQETIMNLHWHPFKVVVNEEGNLIEIVDEEDEKLCCLKKELDDEARNAVITALKEMNEYNPSGRIIVPELWNFKEGRRARLVEGVEQLSVLKRRRC